MHGLLSKQFLQDIGVTLDEQTYQSLSMHYEQTLNERVITEIVDELEENQLKDLHNLRNGDVSALQQWLATNVPQLDAIIEDEIAILLGEMAEGNELL